MSLSAISRIPGFGYQSFRMLPFRGICQISADSSCFTMAARSASSSIFFRIALFLASRQCFFTASSAPAKIAVFSNAMHTIAATE